MLGEIAVIFSWWRKGVLFPQKFNCWETESANQILFNSPGNSFSYTSIHLSL